MHTDKTTDDLAAAEPAAARSAPVLEVAPETFVIQALFGAPDAPQLVPMNSMVIRAAEPVVVDTGTPLHREQHLRDLFALVEPEDVRWVFVSHEDADHVGNLEVLMEVCPNATMVGSWFLCERLVAGGLTVPPSRWRWVGDGETLDVGDRTLVAVRPPAYDEPTTRGLFDPTTGVYWGSDCFAAPVTAPTAWASELPTEAWEGGFTTFHLWNSPWTALLDERRFSAEVHGLEVLGVRTIASCHGPVIDPHLVPRSMELLRSLPGGAAEPQPGQPVLDEIVASMAAAG